MSKLDALIESVELSPPKMVVYGQPGVGKTTFAASAEAVLLDCENGAGAVPGLRRTPYLETWTAMREWLQELATTEDADIRAVAIDTVDWLVQRIVEHVVVDLDGKSPGDITNTLGTAHGGYFKAREIVQNIVYRDVLPMLNAITELGRVVILLGHAANVKMTTPEGYDLQIAAPDLPQFIAPVFIEWADAVLYATRDTDGRRVLVTEGTNVVLAKNRYGLIGELPLSWQDLLAAMSRRPDDSPASPQTEGE
ncbi:MAG: ATP-binding protein [Planctomycetota bacterium]